MRPIVIIKTGRTLPALVSSRGDFENWVMAGLKLPADSMRVVRAENEDLPAYEALSAAVITGSHSMVTEHAPWSERVAEWLGGLVARHIPTLGICYGHQLLAYALGGAVADNPHGPEYGTVRLKFHSAAYSDALFGSLSQPVYVHVSHFQSVVTLPAGAKLLASSAQEPHQAFVVGDCAWGLQFHPEFDEEIVTAYLRAYETDLQQRGIDTETCRKSCQPTPESARILAQFGKMCRF